jgi:tartronate-semialdehyde synthase
MAEVDYQPDLDEALPWSKPAPDPLSIAKAMDLIGASQAPLMILGGGVILADATDEFRELAEYLSIPVIMTYMGKGGLPYDHPLNAGHAGIQVGQPIGNRYFLESDLVVGVGCRFTDRHTGKIATYRGNRKFIHIDIEPAQIGRFVPAEVGIVSDAKLALVALLEEAKRRGYHPPASERVRRLPQIRREIARKTDYDDVPIKPQRVFQEINRFFPPNTIFTTGCGITQIWSGQLQNITRPRRYLPSGGAGTLGYELPAAIGAKVACPDDPAVVVVGDAGLLFMAEELAMAGQHKVPIVIVVVNNGYLGLIRQNQKYAYGYEHGVSLWYCDGGLHPDNVKLVEAFGGRGERVTDVRDLEAAFARAIASPVPYLIDVIVEREADCSMGGSVDAVREFV